MKNVKLTLEEVLTLHQKGELAAAKKGYLEILQDHPQERQALHMLGVLFAELGELDAAQEYLEAAIKVDSENETLYLHLANILKAKGMYAKAADILQKLTVKNPRFAAAFNNLGAVLYAQAKLAESVQAYQTAIEIQPNYVDAYYNLALALTKLRRYEEARLAFEALLALAPAHAGGQFQLACLEMQQGQYKNAIKHFLLIAENYPTHVETQTNLATSYLKLGDLQEAKIHYLRALEFAAHDVQILFNLGVINMQTANVAEAISFYSRVVQIDNDHYAAHNNLGYAYLIMRDHQNALLHFREALRLQPDNTALRHTINILNQDKTISTSPIEYVQSLFDSYADHFDEHLKKGLRYQVPQMMHATLQELKLLSAKLKILDLGCGSGLAGEIFKPDASLLIGVDISEKMLQAAAEKNIYDELIQADIVTFLETRKTLAINLIIAADVLVYTGDLKPLFFALQKAIHTQSIFIYNAEIDATENYVLNISGRFSHSKKYLDELAAAFNFEILDYRQIPMRTQEKQIVHGHLYVLRKKS